MKDKKYVMMVELIPRVPKKFVPIVNITNFQAGHHFVCLSVSAIACLPWRMSKSFNLSEDGQNIKFSLYNDDDADDEEDKGNEDKDEDGQCFDLFVGHIYENC